MPNVFELRIETDNAAFGDTLDDRAAELARILRNVANRVELGVVGAAVLDHNGNKVGSFILDADERD
jgi:hypothetical protein